jgi:endonuclease/exonuclease/phosphatase family metal-dependent hydrolase
MKASCNQEVNTRISDQIHDNKIERVKQSESKHGESGNPRAYKNHKGNIGHHEIGIEDPDNSSKQNKREIKLKSIAEDHESRSNRDERVKDRLRRFISNCYRKLEVLGSEMLSMSKEVKTPIQKAITTIQSLPGPTPSTRAGRVPESKANLTMEEGQSSLKETKVTSPVKLRESESDNHIFENNNSDQDQKIWEENSQAEVQRKVDCENVTKCNGMSPKHTEEQQVQEPTNQESHLITQNKKSGKVGKKLTSGQIRIVINNISGIGIRTNKMQRVVEWMEKNNYDILMAQEANVSFKHQQVKQHLRKISQSKYHFSVSETEFNFKKSTKPGGTFILTNKKLRSRIIHKISDPAGRWAGNVYGFQGGEKIALISMYQICQWKNTGGITSRAQQVAWLCKNNRNISPIAAHREDLTKLIDSLRKENIDILLAGDFNEHDMNKGTLYALCHHGLIPINQGKPRESYQRGQTCIDHMFATSNLINKIQEANYKQYPSEFDTDHRPMEVLLNLTHLATPIETDITNPERQLFSNNWKDVRKYVLKRLSLFKHYKINEKLNRLETIVQENQTTAQLRLRQDSAQLVDKVDMQHTKLCLESERSLNRRRKLKTSVEVQEILDDLNKIRVKIRRSKQAKEIQQIKTLIIARRKASKSLIQAYKDQWKVKERSNDKEIKQIEILEPCGKKAASDKRTEISRLKMKRLYHKISYYTGKRKDTECINIKEEDTWINDPDAILQAIVKHNREHFSQAKGCIFSNPELQVVVDPQSSVFDQISMPLIEEEFIKELRNKALPPVPDVVELHDWKHKFKTWRESTRTSPSGMHLGHFKSLLSTVYSWENGKCEVDREVLMAQQDLFEATLRILNLAIQSERPLTRWKTATNIVIPKKKDVHELKNLRNIHIYECDLNALLSLKWKEALVEAEKTDFMVQSQFGSRKEKSSHNPVFIENAQLEIARLTRKQYGQINYDARACYDRILPNLAAMTSLVHGVPNRLVNLHNRLLEEMQYEVYIEGASKSLAYTSEKDNMVYGSGQGCGNSPFVWLFISNILLKMFNQEAVGATYNSQRNHRSTVIQATAYVDDVNTHHNVQNKNDCLEEQMQQDFRRWKDILEMSGGLLAQEKCSYYKIKWGFHNSGKPEMEDGQNEVMRIENIDMAINNIDQKHKTLGFLVSPKTPRKFQQQQWKEVEDRFGTMLDVYDLTYKETEILYKRIYMPTIRYLLPFATLNGKEIQKTTRSTITKFLRKSGYSNNTARDTVYGSRQLGGLEWSDMEVEQGVQNLATLIHSYHDGGIMGNLLQILLEKWCWFIGFCPLQHNSVKVCYDESMWLSNIDVFLKKHDITLKIESKAPPLLRENDEYIMIIVSQLNLSSTETRYINYCRLHLNVISIAELADEDGKYIRHEMYENPSSKVNASSSNCIQNAPPIRKWSLWRKVLNHLTFCKRRKLRQNLGKWTVPSSSIRQKYPYYSNLDTLYHQTTIHIESYEIYNKTKGKETGYKTNIPNNAYPCVVTSTGQILSTIECESITPDNAEEEFGYSGSVIAVTDASVVGHQGTWAAIITDLQGKELNQMQGSISVEGLTSFRAELDGCRGVLTLLKRYPNVTTITLFCDNIAVIHRLTALQHSWPSISWSDYDLLMEVKQIMPKHVQFKHVKGHQGSSCQPEFNLETNLNILMDMRAKQTPENTSIPETNLNFSIKYRGNRVTGPIVRSLRQEISDTRLKLFYQNKMQENYDEVHWEAFQFACDKGNITKSIFKLMHNIAPTFKTLHKRQISYDALCPICFNAEETNQHILICPSKSEIYNKQFCDKLRTRLKLKTDEEMQILEDIFVSITTSTQGKLKEVDFTKQIQLGWGHCIRGFITSEWKAVANLFTTEKSEKEIIGSIIIEIWNIWHVAWNHRNAMFKEEDRYKAQSAIKQRTVDLNIIYGCRDYIPIELQVNLKLTVDEHLKLDEKVIDEWLKMYRPIFYKAVCETDAEIWKRTETDFLNTLDF